MKKILSVVLIAISLHCYTQEFAPFGATWQFSYNSFWITGYVEIECIGDTVINDTTYRVLTKVYHLYDYLNYTFSIDTIGSVFTYQEGNKVYILRNNQLYTLFDFEAEIGDWWVIPQTFDAFGECDSIGYVQVDSLSTIIINGMELRQLYVSPKDESHWGYGNNGYDVLTEKIGSMHWYLFPEITPNCGVADWFEGGLFRCYEDNDIGLYSVLSQGYCDSIHTGISEYEYQEAVSVYPNPFSTSTTIEYELYSKSNMQFTVYNMMGETVHHDLYNMMQAGSHKITWSPGVLPSGLYYGVLRTEEKVSVVKLVKQE